MRFAAPALFLGLACLRAFGMGLPENVLVVQNGNSPVSCRIAAYYISGRNLPPGNLATVYTADSSLSAANEVMTPTNFETLIRQPIVSFLSANGLTNTVQYIVLTKGIPHRFTNEPSEGYWGGRSVDSMLAATDLVDPIEVDITDQGVLLGTTFISRYWLARGPFQHTQFGGYLVTRLDGYTEDDAKSLVDRSLATQSLPYHVLLDEAPGRGLGNPALQPKSILLPDGTLDDNYALHYEDFNADMTRASQVISARPYLSIQLDQTNTFVLGSSALTGYVSWGSNDSSFSATTYLAEPFAAAGIAETAVSTSARTFFHVTSGQSVITDLIMPRASGASGVAGVKGYATEPFLDAVASPTALLDLYTSGHNLAESYYAASRFVGWKDIVIGDPLCALTGPAVASLSAAKAFPDGWLVSLGSMIVSAGTDDFGDRIYVQDSSRTSGIQARTDTPLTGLADGTTVTVRGILATIDGERIITDASLAF